MNVKAISGFESSKKVLISHNFPASFYCMSELKTSHRHLEWGHLLCRCPQRKMGMARDGPEPRQHLCRPLYLRSLILTYLC